MNAADSAPSLGPILEELTQALDSGRNAAVTAPAPLWAWLGSQVRRRLQERYTFTPLALPANEGGGLLAALWSALMPGREEEDPQVRSLAAAPALEGRVFEVFSPAGEFARWGEFLETYEAACREVAESRRCLFLVWCDNLAARKDVTPAPALAVVTLRGTLGRIDSMVAAWTALAAGETPLRRNLLTALGAELGRWDLELCAGAVSRGRRLLTEPLAVLAEYRLSRTMVSGSWPETDVPEHNLYEGAEESHSCSGVNFPNAAVVARVLRAQLAVLLPFLADEGRRIATDMRNKFQVPYVNAFGERIHSREELEIGDLAAQIRKGLAVCQPVVADRVRLIRDARNQLAHGQVMNPRLLETLLEEFQ